MLMIDLLSVIVVPKLSVTMSPRYSRYCTISGRSSPSAARRSSSAASDSRPPTVAETGSPGATRSRRNTIVLKMSTIGMMSNSRSAM